MARVERRAVVVPEPMATQLRAAVEAGEYASTDEALGDAVRLWSLHRRGTEGAVTALRQAWDAGKAGGIHGRVDLGDLRREARGRLAAAESDGR